MANLTPEQELINRNHILHQTRQHISFDLSCPECQRIEKLRLMGDPYSTNRSDAYNNQALDKLLENEAELRRMGY